MRALAATFALIASLLLGLLGAGYFLSARYTGEVAATWAATRGDHLAPVSAKLPGPEALVALRGAEATKAPRPRGSSQPLMGHARVWGVMFSVGAAMGLFAVILLFVDRARKIAILLVALGFGVALTGLIIAGGVVLLAVIVGLDGVAMLLAWRRGARGRLGPQPSDAISQGGASPTNEVA
ncbi:MAG: hypothetical protein KAI47_24865 [Deltaproteobacteria bacterium]|nr:hypothetical protein [Deltaproteobacteria bacterium]